MKISQPLVNFILRWSQLFAQVCWEREEAVYLRRLCATPLEHKEKYACRAFLQSDTEQAV